MKAQWQAEKDAIQKIQAKEGGARAAAYRGRSLATRRGDLQKAAEISYGRLPEYRKRNPASSRSGSPRSRRRGSI